MGITLSSIHIFSAEPIAGFENFLSISDGWQTYLPQEMPENLFEYRKLTKNISKKTDAPVLWFYIFDDEAISFEFYQNGKRTSAYDSQGLTGTKNLYGIPTLIGYEDGQKRRLSRILACADIPYQVELLEEFFGVCLLICPDVIGMPNIDFRRVRSDNKYQDLLAEEKKITAKQSQLKAELVYEEKGKLFEHHFAEDMRMYRPHLYYFGYATELSNMRNGDLKPVRFMGGQLIDITQEEFDSTESKLCRHKNNDDRFTEEYYPVYKVLFTDKAPEDFRGKTFILPRGYEPSWFDHKDRLILTNEKGSVMFVDASLKAVAKLHLKGEPVDYIDGHILTAGHHSFYAYCFHPTDTIRIYKLIERE